MSLEFIDFYMDKTNRYFLFRPDNKNITFSMTKTASPKEEYNLAIYDCGQLMGQLNFNSIESLNNHINHLKLILKAYG